MFSQTAEYALRAVVYMAGYPEKVFTTKQVAEATKVPAGYLSKVLQGVARAGIIQGQRGLNGGFTLDRRPEEITIFEIIQAVDPIKRITTCPLGLKAHGVNLCALHRRLDDAIAQVEASFKETTLADLIADPNESRMLCELPVRP